MDFPEYRAIQDRYDCFLLLPELNAKKLAELIQSVDRSAGVYTYLRVNNKRAAADLNWERVTEDSIGVMGIGCHKTKPPADK